MITLRTMFKGLIGIALACVLLINPAEARNPRGGALAAVGGGATLVFNYADFSGSPLITVKAAAAISGSKIQLTSGTHSAGGAGYNSQPNIQTFTTDFTFQIANASGYGLFFAVQNSNNTTNPLAGGATNGVAASACANTLGYGCFGPQHSIGNSVAIKFDATAFNGNNFPQLGSPISGTGLYIDGGQDFSTINAFAPEYDLAPFNVGVASNNVMSAHVVYDGTLLTMVLTDTATGATTRMSWPVDIPAVVGANTAWVGFTGGSPNAAVTDAILSWAYWTGYNTRLAAPTFSVTPGQYTGTQSVSLSGPAGASIYYTTNGLPPTTASTLYTGTPISVSSSQLVQAISVESTFTDSLVAQGNYQIQSASPLIINFPGGFASANGLIRTTGYAHMSGANIILNDTAHTGEAGGAWYVVPLTATTFDTTFRLSLTSANANACAFVMQNYPQTSTGTNFNLSLGGQYLGVLEVTGGPYMLGQNGSDAGYTGIYNSIAVIFDYFHGSGNLTGLYVDGAQPVGSSLDMTGSGVSLHAGHALDVHLVYNGTTLVETVTDTVNSSVYTHTYTVDIPTHLGSSLGYAGFTAGAGGSTANVSITQWTY